MVKRVKKINKKISRKKIKKKCPHCYKETDDFSRFCKHCGASLFPEKAKRKHHCPNCKGIIEEFSRFCRHCGSNIDTFIHTKMLKFFMYLVLFLILALALILFFAPMSVKNGEEEIIFDVSKSFVKIGDSFCSWQDGSFKACTTVNWEGKSGDYVKCDFANGNSDGQKIYQSPFTCCEDVGSEEGLRLVRAFLFDSGGKNYKDDGGSVVCSDKPETFVSSAVQTVIYKKNFWFTAKRTKGRGEGEGFVFVDFPGNVKSCEFDGSWVTDNQNTVGTQTEYCHKARGIFNGDADEYGQSIFSDPNEFRWAGPQFPLVDPIGELFKGYSVYFWTCSSQYYKKPEYFVSGKFSGFGTDILRFDWIYYNEYPQPNVDVFVNMVCEIEKSV